MAIATKLTAKRPLGANEVLDAPESSWVERPWSERREAGPDEQPFCDIAASMTLAKLASAGGKMPMAQKFLRNADIVAWRATFDWGTAWCACRGNNFWAWASGDAVADSRAEIAGAIAQWDEDVAEEFAQSLGAGPVEIW